MWLLLRALLAQWAVRHLVLRSFGSLLLLLPLAAILKAAGFPLLILLGILALPLMLVLFVIGLPVLLVILTGAVLLAITGLIVAMGMVMLKIALMVCLVVLAFRAVRALMRRRDW